MTRAIILSSMALVAAICLGSSSWGGTQADECFRRAIAAEQAGDKAERDRQLAEALQADPQHKLARWYSGQVLHNGQWQSPTEIGRTVGSDPRWQEYQRRVDTADDTLAAHAELARWCRTQGLELEQKWHWIHVLRHDRANREALGALGLRIYRGSYASPEQIAAAEAGERSAKMAFKHYSDQLKSAMREAERTDGSQRSSALENISHINDPAAVPAIVEIVLADVKNEKRVLEKLGVEKGEALLRQMQLAAIKALADMPENVATQSLLQVAMYASDKDVREQAARQLRHREPTSYMPQLMAALSAPIELEISVHTLPNGQITVYEDFTEKGPTATRKHSRASSFLTQHVNFHTNDDFRGGSRTRISAVWSENWRDMANASAQVANTQDQVELENAVREERNARIERVLELATGKELGDDPEAWWNDWKDYNELYTPEVLPVAETEEQYDYSRYIEHYTRSSTRPAGERASGTMASTPERGRGMPSRNMTSMPAGGPRSCFAAGTPVWTQAGPVAIEKIQTGDFVLSQNPHTGELDYRPVLLTTTTPDNPTLQLAINDETIVTTGGHRLWEVDRGWRMARQLKPGGRLSSTSGAAELLATQKGGAMTVYNLEVGEFHTFFVGRSRVLVHDSTCPEPTINVLPGISPRSELSPAELALR